MVRTMLIVGTLLLLAVGCSSRTEPVPQPESTRLPAAAEAPATPPSMGSATERDATLRRYDIDPARFVLLTLSRLSPEKRVERLLDALLRIERDDPTPAYMGGDRYYEALRRRAAGLQHIQVRFPGYVAGEAKWALFAAADLFCSPSHYEAYGLTIAQALASGTPVLAAPHQGAQATIDDDRGWLVEPEPAAFARAISHAVALGEAGALPPMRAAAANWGRANPFSDAATKILRTLDGI